MKNGCKPSIYLYPITPYTFAVGANDYIIRKSNCLNEEFSIINSGTRIGLLDIVLKFFKTDILYFNWIEDVADKNFGYLQVALLFIILLCSRLLNKKVIWFVHNNVSHYPKNRKLKNLIRRMMAAFADKIFTHSHHLDLYNRLRNISCFDHPTEENQFVEEISEPEFDVLIWGSQSPYKGISDLLQYNRETKTMQNIRFLIAGEFPSSTFFAEVKALQEPNITIINRVIEDSELVDLFKKTRYVVFCYKKHSVLSSAALSKTLSFGKTIIGPSAGCFKELAEKELVLTYDSFEELNAILQQSLASNKKIDQAKILSYIKANDWDHFKQFLVREIQETTSKGSLTYKKSMA
jgi:beta-1,4-mannosyltransferase